MAVTKQVYTATATWTASQLAGIFESAFIDAGLMTAWYDSFLSGSVENRVLEVVYDGVKTYGKTYYWFMFTTTGVFIHTALSWTAGSDVPGGTQYLDYFATTTNSTTNHRTLLTLAAATTTTLTRYTSGVNSGCTWFVLRNGTSNQAFMIPSATYGPSAMVDLSKVAFNGMVYTATGANNNISSIDFIQSAGHTRRTYLGASGLRGSITSSHYVSTTWLHRYFVFGNGSSTSTNWQASNSLLGVGLPTAHSNTNTSLAADHIPIFTGPTANPYMAALPSDFGVAAYYASNTMTVQDTLVVASGTEEWEMLVVGNNATTDAGRILLLARTV